MRKENAGRLALTIAVLLLSATVPALAAGSEAEVVPATAATVHSAVGSAGAKVVLVNVWSTWCGPCIEEFTDLIKLQKAYADEGLKVIFVSGNDIEDMQEVKEFLAEQQVDFETYIMNGSPQAFIEGLHPEWSGALPFTIIFDGSAKLHRFWEGAASYTTFEQRVLDVLRGN